MLTVDDIKKLVQVFATKEDLKKNNQDLRNDFSQHFATKQDLITGLESVRDELKAFRNEVLDRFDKVFGELKEMRQERVFQDRTNDRVDDRLTKLERQTTSKR